MINQISFLGVSFHLYGLVLGFSALLVYYLVEKVLRVHVRSFSETHLFKVAVLTAIGSILGARIWHVLTDYWIYVEAPITLFFIWNGGLSIFGALLGGAIALALAQKKYTPHIPFRLFLDAVAVSLPFGQSSGRWANFINQELYGKPTHVPWAIPIELSARVSGYEQYTHFHPLFLYESVVLALFGIWLWRQQKKHPIGSGFFVFWYVFFYLSWRFFSDFLRIGVPRVLWGMSINQSILLCIVGVMIFLYVRTHLKI